MNVAHSILRVNDGAPLPMGLVGSEVCGFCFWLFFLFVFFLHCYKQYQYGSNLKLLGNKRIESLYLLREVSWPKCMREKERLRERQRKTKSQRIIIFLPFH